MKLKLLILVLILFFSNCIYSQFDNLKNNSNELEAKYIKNQLFVKIKDEIDFNPINAIEPREFSNKIKITKAFKLIELQKIYLVEVLDSSITTDSVIRFFTKNEAVEYVERVPLYELFWTPNDPMYLQQWNLQKIQADLAWNISQGKQQIRVAITDDGFLMNHEDLTSKWFINSAENPTNGIDDDNNGYIDDWRGWDAADNDNNPAAFNPSNNYFDHGTHVAGITTVATNNAKGIAGIGVNIQLIPVKIGANSNASLTGAYQGVEYAIIANANVINMSWGGGAFSQTYQNLFNVAKSKNIVCVAAAGNSSTSSWMYPASYQNVISVASTTNTDALSWFSNFGTAIDVCAPGSNILSCHATGITNYTNMSGTSMAAPLVSGLCGLMLSHNLMPADSIEACLKRTSNNINANNPNRIGQIGAGRINAFQALQCVTKNPISSFDVLDTFQCNGQLVRYQATSNGAQPLTYQWIFPGGSPSTSTFANPGVTYSSAGLKSATLITCNTLGCDTITKTNIVRIDTPSAWLTGRKYTTYNSNPAVIAVNFKGNPPYNVTLTDGTNTWVQNNITANPYFFSIVPQLNTSLISIQSFTAKNCIGKVSKQDTIVKIDLNANNINCDTTNLNVGRVLHLDFNGNTQDKSGNNNHANNFGATPVAGKNGAANSAYRFDGINDFMEINSSSTTNITSNISIAAIIKVNGFNPQLPQNASSVLTKGNDNSVGFYTLRFTDDVIQNNADTNTSQFYGQFTNDGIVNIYNSTCDVPPFINKNNWFCAIYTFDGDTAKMYINGQLLWKFKTNTQIGNNNQKVRIGSSFNNFPHEYFLNADIDDIRIYNRVLSASEVKGYCGTCNINPPANDCDTTNLNVGRVLHLDFNGNTQDKSGNNNHATNFGATPVAGKNGTANTAYRFDGINDFMRINHHSSLNMTNITLTAVLKPNGFYNGTCYGNQIIKKGNTDFVSGEYGLGYSPNGYTNSCFVFDTVHQNYAGYVFNNRPSPNLNNTSPYVIKGQWDCLVYTKNNDSTKFYINGVLKYATASNSHGSNLDDIFIGKLNNWQYPYWLNADIDDIRIYNRVLSASEVKGYCGTCNINPPANDCDTNNLNVGRVLHLDFNGNTQDKSGNNNHATNFGATPVAGKNGTANTAYRFDGINDFMRVNHHSSLNLPNQFTFTCILKPIKFNTAHCFGNVIIGKGDGGSSVGQYNLQYFPFDNGTTCVNRDTTLNNFHFHGVNWCNYTLVTNKPNLKSGTWYCMVATYDGTTLRHFLNGNLVYQCNISLNSINQSNTFDVLIGKWASSSLPHWLNADIDDIRIYNRVLSASEVKGYCGTCENIVFNDSILNNYASVSSFDSCSNSLNVDQTNGFQKNTKVLLIQMKGAIIDSTNSSSFGNILNIKNAGRFEYNEISETSKNSLKLKFKLQNSYDFKDGLVQIVSIPKFKNYNVDKKLTCMPWSGKKGGIFIIDVEDTLNLNNNIDVSNKGFLGGKAINSFLNFANCNQNNFFYPNGSTLAAPKGESISNISSSKIWGKGKLATGGGGGNDHNSGGGGGGNATSGGFGAFQLYECTYSNFDNRGIGGIGIPYNSSTKRIFLGGGAGAGHCNNGFHNPSNYLNADGGNGGGIIILNSKFIKGNNKSIIANGENGKEINNSNLAFHEGMGGGGAGGTILVNSNSVISPINIFAKGGKGGDMFAGLSGGIVGGGGGGSGGCVLSNITSANLIINISGGANGKIIQNNSNHGATSGQNGIIQNNWSINNILTDTFKSNCKPCSYGSKKSISKCNNESITLNSSPGFQHIWSPKIGLSNDTIQSPVCTINQNTTYYALKKDSAGCQIVDTFIIQIRAVSKFEPISDTLICIGDSATINIKNRTNPIWSPNTHIRALGTNQFKLFPNQSTDYILNYQDTFGCSFKDTISIKTKICCSLRAQFEMSKTNLCFGDSLMVNNSSSSISGVSFNWSIQPNTVSVANYNGIQPTTLFFENAGDYTIELIGDNGSCKDTFLKTILVTKLNPNAGNDTFYCGNALQYQLGESPIRGFKYSWNPTTGLNHSNISNPTLSLANQKIDYILQMEDTLSGCRFYDTVVVSAFNFKNFSKIIDTLICDRDSIMVSLPSFTKSAIWKNAIHISDSLSKQPLLFPKDTQRYIVHFEDSNRCQYQDTFDLFTKICCEHLPHFLVAKNTICFGETLQITENSTYKTPVNHKWKVIPNTVSPSFSSGKTPPNFQFLDSVKYQIWLTIYDSFCIDSFLREVKVVRIYPNAGIDQSSCRLQNNFSLGFPPVDGYQYVWTPSLYLSNPFISNPTASVFRDSIRYILETRDIASQCVFNYAVDIKTKKVIDSSVAFDTLCEKSTLDFHGNILNTSGFYDTILSDVLNTCDSIYKATHLFIYPRKDSLWTQQYGCKTFRYKNTVFEKDTFLLDSIFNSKGCLVSILQIPIEILNTTIEDSTIIACGSYLHNGLLLTESYKRIKTNRVPFFRRPTCDSVWRNIGLNILPTPKAIIEPDNKNNPIPYGTKLNLEGKGGDFYQWNFENSTEKSIVYEAFQDYRFTLVVSLQNECKDTATYFVKVGEIPDGKIVFPNAFSPNGDQVNDYFKPNSYQFGALVSLSIFNRWGEKIFENFNQDAYWDGTYKNEIQPSGVYIYIATFKSPKGDLKTIKGDFLLVR